MYTNFQISPELKRQLDSWPLYKNPSAVALILVAYTAFVLYLGPKFMKNRKPFNLKNVIVLYNALQVVCNLWILSWSALDPICIKHFFYFACVETTPQKEQDLQMLMCMTYWYMLVNKIVNLLDTIFFVLCKKQDRISFLHVQHHVLSVAIVWIVGKYFIGIELGVAFLCNTVVHTIMYFYYLIAALGPAYKKYLWWKKYLTRLQIVQFIFVIVYLLAAVCFGCGFKRTTACIVILHAFLNLALFLRFYFDTYDSKKLMSDKIAVCSSLQFSSNYAENQTDANENNKKIM